MDIFKGTNKDEIVIDYLTKKGATVWSFIKAKPVAMGLFSLAVIIAERLVWALIGVLFS